MVEIKDLCKSFGSSKVLDNFSLQLETGSLMALLGPSGCGKTTVLRILAGLCQADSGTVHIDGLDQGAISPGKRRLGYVFQQYALFQNLKVAQNIAFGLHCLPYSERPTKKSIRARVDELLSLVQMEGFANRHTLDLSGGQKQRVALARALAPRPRILLLDEPFAALDAHVRRDMRSWLASLQKELNLTCILVTHDQEEAFGLADSVAIMQGGKIEQCASPEELYLHPSNTYVYKFLGKAFEFPGGYARAYEIAVSRGPRENTERGIISALRFTGSSVILEIECLQNSKPIEAELALDDFVQEAWRKGETVYYAPKRVSSFVDEGIGI